MNKTIQMLLAIASLLLPVETVLSSTETPQFVNVSIEIHGLEESAKTLNQASLELAKKLTEMSPEVEKMSPEQLQQLALVIEQANLLVAAVNNAVDMAGPALESLKEPTRASDCWHTRQVGMPEDSGATEVLFEISLFSIVAVTSAL